MSTIAHPIFALSICILFRFITNKKFNYPMSFLFIISSILPDTFCIMMLLIQTMGRVEGDEIEPIRNVPHELLSSVWGWTIGSLIIAGLLFYLLEDQVEERDKLTIKQIYLIILSSGFIHMFIDGFTQWIWIFGDFYICYDSFFTTSGIGGEQDFIIVYFLTFFIFPLFLLYLSLEIDTKKQVYEDVFRDSEIVIAYKKISKQIKKGGKKIDRS